MKPNMQCIQSFKIFFLGILLLSSARSIPRYALMNGESCNLCHINPSGSGLRSEYGISLVSGEELPFKPEKVSYTGMISEHLQLGGDVRFQRIVAQLDTTGVQTAGFPMQADIYGSVKPTKKIDILWKIDLLNYNHHVWTQLRILPNGGMFRIGKTMPSYGLRIPDHTAFIRGGNMSLTHEGLVKEGLPFNSRLIAPFTFETAIYLGNSYITVGISNAFLSSTNWGMTFVRNLRHHALFARMEYIGTFRSLKFIGGSSVIHENDLNIRGVFGGLSLGSVQWLVETDWARNWAGENVSLATYHNMNYELTQGLDVGFTFETFDVDVDSSGQSIQRMSFGFDFIPFPFIQIKAHMRMNETINPNTKAEPEYLLQLHTWF